MVKGTKEYNAKIIKVVDGDTVDVDIDLGFGIVLTDERVRIMGIDTPESRTSDKVEKVFGLASKERLKQLLAKESILVTTIDKGGEDMKGKFGRVLGDFKCYYAPEDREATVSEILIKEGHAVAYHGQSKDDVQGQHMINRERLLKEGNVSQADVDAAEDKMK
ncbi:MAG: thermonuclease family protein [Candidatus Poseidoniales archaeon]|jgi:micrococcal nuclease